MEPNVDIDITFGMHGSHPLTYGVTLRRGDNMISYIILDAETFRVGLQSIIIKMMKAFHGSE